MSSFLSFYCGIYRNIGITVTSHLEHILGIRPVRTLCSSSSSLYNKEFLRPKLSPLEVTQILRKNETVIHIGDEFENESALAWDALHTEFPHNSISFVDSNQLESNLPIEDKLAAAKCLLTTGYFFGVFDGHGGPECSQVVSKRLFNYIAASLLPKSELRRITYDLENHKPVELVKVFNDPTAFVPELEQIYMESLTNWCKELLNTSNQDFSMEEALIGSFLRLDKDLSMEVENNRYSPIFEPLLRVALSGSVACVVHIDGPHIHIANTGDCAAVLGMDAEGTRGGWIAHRLTVEHNWENASEVQRLLSEHPKCEADTVVNNQRLLGMLLPFRAFGDFRFKWDRRLQLLLVEPYLGSDGMPVHCVTPPYLTALPQVSYHRLRPHDRFLILGSDGLWEGTSPLDATTLVGEHMSGRPTLQPVQLPKRHVTLGEISRLLDRRQSGLELKPVDTNAATHLIRHTLGGTDSGLDHGRLSHSLALAPEVRRFFRDDISIHVIFFDSKFIRFCPVDL